MECVKSIIYDLYTCTALDTDIWTIITAVATGCLVMTGVATVIVIWKQVTTALTIQKELNKETIKLQQYNNRLQVYKDIVTAVKNTMLRIDIPTNITHTSHTYCGNLQVLLDAKVTAEYILDDDIIKIIDVIIEKISQFELAHVKIRMYQPTGALYQSGVSIDNEMTDCLNYIQDTRIWFENSGWHNELRIAFAKYLQYRNDIV